MKRTFIFTATVMLTLCMVTSCAPEIPGIIKGSSWVSNKKYVGDEALPWIGPIINKDLPDGTDEWATITFTHTLNFSGETTGTLDARIKIVILGQTVEKSFDPTPFSYTYDSDKGKVNICLEGKSGDDCEEGSVDDREMCFVIDIELYCFQRKQSWEK